ncbi:hypothetical protein LJR219_001086 [Phenylobacterium sp. LjRoot219]|uniref:hypothetical protein n=1 Tax=Phenylobacterium sp. LjRoot219 TaxID=3342283 RepID=UPI003ED0BB8F
MRIIVMAAGLAACLGLSACEQSKSEATEVAAPAPRKSLSRQATLYAGQEQILQVDSATVEPGNTETSLTLKASGKTEAAGYYQLSFLPRVNAAAPPDGIYDVDVIGYKPQGAVAPAVTPVEVKGEWGNAPKARLKGVRFITKTNEVVAMLPAG